MKNLTGIYTACANVSTGTKRLIRHEKVGNKTVLDKGMNQFGKSNIRLVGPSI